MHAPEDVPLWVPAPVRSNVIVWLKNPQYREHPRDLAVLLRLATDLRMQTVWNELKNSLPSKLKRFFFVAYDAAAHPRRLMTAKELVAEAARVSTSAEVVRWIDQPAAKQLDEVARAMRDRSRRLGADQIILSPDGWRPPLVIVQRHEESDAVRAYVIELVGVTRKLFKRAMRGTIKTAAEVALGTTVTERQVRKWTS